MRSRCCSPRRTTCRRRRSRRCRTSRSASPTSWGSPEVVSDAMVAELEGLGIYFDTEPFELEEGTEPSLAIDAQVQGSSDVGEIPVEPYGVVRCDPSSSDLPSPAGCWSGDGDRRLLRVGDHDPAPAEALGLVHRRVGRAEQRLAVVVGVLDDDDAAPDGAPPAVSSSGSARAATIRFPISSAALLVGRSAASTTNSSPASRHGSPSRTTRRSRSATCTRSSSPSPWPSRSFTGT